MAIKKTTSFVEKIEDIDIVDHLEQGFLDYAVAVITDRALPDVRDGLKSSHRKSVYTMGEEKVTSDKKFVKEHSIIGNTMARYYTHGDASLKDAIDRLGQDWIMREPLVQGKGNIGDIRSNLKAAAARYLEIKLSVQGDIMLKLIKNNVVDMIKNYDGTRLEPVVLPSLFPNILVNPNTGIAVSMACEWLPHAMEEACNAVIAYLKNNDISYEELIKIMPGPDFPLGGVIVNQEDMIDCYKTGKGKVVIRGIHTILDAKTTATLKKEADLPTCGTILSFKELPYEVATNKLVDKINDLIIEEKLPGILEAFDKTELNDATKKVCPEVLIFIEKNANIDQVLELLYLYTPIQNNVNFNMVGLLGKVPKLYTLKDVLKDYSDHICSVHRRDIQFHLNKEEHDLHILLGFQIALANIDEVIKTIRASKGKTDGVPALVNLLGVDMEQAEAIWNRRLGSLSNMDIEKVEKDIESTEKEILRLKNLLENLIDYVINSLNEIKTIGTSRRTKLDNIDLSYQKTAKTRASKPEIPEEQIVVVFNKTTGVIKQMKKGNGFKCSNLDFLYLFTAQGSLIKIQGHELPSDDKTTIEVMDMNDKVVSFIQFTGSDNIYHITENGNIKGTKGIEYINVSKKSTNSIKLKPDDIVTDVIACNDKTQLIKITTSTGDILDFKTSDISIGGKLTSGRQRIKFDKNETISKIELVETVE